MNQRIIKKYIDDYDFLEAIRENREDYLSKGNLDNYIAKHGEKSLYSFAEDFWNETNKSVKKLKDKYGIINSIGYRDIIINFPTQEYIEFLRCYYKGDCTLDELCVKFSIPQDKARELIIDIKYENEVYCSNCLSNVQNLKRRNGKYEVRCSNCHRLLREATVLDKETAEKKMEQINEMRKSFIRKMKAIEKELSEVKCPNCFHDLTFKYDDSKRTSRIVCEGCGCYYLSVEKVKEEYKNSMIKAANIKKIHEDEEKRLKLLKESKTDAAAVIDKEELILLTHCAEAFKYIDNKNIQEDERRRYYFTNIKKLKRIDRKVLLNILFAAQKQNWVVHPVDGNLDNALYIYEPKETVISELIKSTNIVPVRMILRRLIDKKFLIVDESYNKVWVPKVLIDNINLVKNILENQNIDGQIRNLVFQRQNFSCSLCGETGRPLKIAYLDKLKNINDLTSMIGVCEDCYDDVTKDEVLIDITLTNKEIESDELKSWEFLVKFLPQAEEEEELYNKVIDWHSRFKDEDIIKALAITINKLNNDEKFSMNAFIPYIEAVLSNGKIKIWDNIVEKFNLDDWI